MNYIIKNFTKFFLFFSILLLAYVVYKSEFIYDGNQRSYYYIYYLISFLFLIFSFISFFLNHVFKEYLIISFITILTFLYCFEIFLTFNNKFEMYISKTGKEYDKRTKLEYYNDFLKINKNVKLVIHPFKYLNLNSEIFPLSGISNSKTIVCNENGYYSTFESDRFGFNNPDSVWDNNQTKYLLIGDSFTLGECVNRPDDIASILRMLSKENVRNIGYSGNGPLIELATLKEYLDDGVEKILWIYVDNDLIDLKNELKNPILRKYMQEPNFFQDLKNNQSQVNTLAENLLHKEKKLITSKKIVKKNENFLFHFFKFLKKK